MATDGDVPDDDGDASGVGPTEPGRAVGSDEGVNVIALVDNVEGLGVVIGRSLADTISYGRNPDPAQSTHLTDLDQLVSTIGVESLEVSDQADVVLRALNDAVIDQTVGPARLGSTGLSIYFPPVLDLADGAYQGVPQAQAWTEFLIAYHTSGYAIARGRGRAGRRRGRRGRGRRRGQRPAGPGRAARWSREPRSTSSWSWSTTAATS